MSDAKNHHYVPQAYLRSFADPQERVWVFNKESRKAFHVSVRNVGSENYFYTSESMGKSRGDRLFVEKELGSDEGKFAGFLRELRAGIDGRGEWRLKKPHRHFLARYIALQFLRTREHRIKQREMIEVMGSTLQKWSEQRGLEVPADVLECLDDPESEAAEIQQQILVNKPLIQEYAGILFRHIWIFFQPPKGCRFLTSDHPVVLCGHVHRRNRGVGIRTRGVEICFPLTPTLLVSLCERTAFPHLVGLDGTLQRYDCPENVMWVNSMQICDSTRMIFSDVNDFSLAEDVLGEHPVLGDVTRRRLRSNQDYM
jgi:hypothetical protein